MCFLSNMLFVSKTVSYTCKQEHNKQICSFALCAPQMVLFLDMSANQCSPAIATTAIYLCSVSVKSLFLIERPTHQRSRTGRHPMLHILGPSRWIASVWQGHRRLCHGFQQLSLGFSHGWCHGAVDWDHVSWHVRYWWNAAFWWLLGRWEESEGFAVDVFEWRNSNGIKWCFFAIRRW